MCHLKAWECGFWLEEKSSDPDSESYRSFMPGLRQLSNDIKIGLAKVLFGGQPLSPNLGAYEGTRLHAQPGHVIGLRSSESKIVSPANSLYPGDSILPIVVTWHLTNTFGHHSTLRMTLYQIPTESFDEVRTVLTSKLSKICRRSLGFDGTFQVCGGRYQGLAVEANAISVLSLQLVPLAIPWPSLRAVIWAWCLTVEGALRAWRVSTSGSLIKILRATTTAIPNRTVYLCVLGVTRQPSLGGGYRNCERASVMENERPYAYTHTSIKEGGNWSVAYSRLLPDAYNGINFQLPFPDPPPFENPVHSSQVGFVWLFWNVPNMTYKCIPNAITAAIERKLDWRGGTAGVSSRRLLVVGDLVADADAYLIWDFGLRTPRSHPTGRQKHEHEGNLTRSAFPRTKTSGCKICHGRRDENKDLILKLNLSNRADANKNPLVPVPRPCGRTHRHTPRKLDGSSSGCDAMEPQGYEY
ncbi:uncharacterized protein CLUP02_11313 [Colletotrichum lupini]|uniref:Uncharacterized protein n=1 Tax=Colletotrichum lupini TaxID=145971 RepID=A0A9Q8SY91_9PEZI|nr:uncharacterized protein CLUP02_11313 [Colletotrichum lupini]UQC85814.1 hypothetical protein CLUP02_11313 [Colletotrichum lupini]